MKLMQSFRSRHPPPTQPGYKKTSGGPEGEQKCQSKVYECPPRLCSRNLWGFIDHDSATVRGESRWYYLKLFALFGPESKLPRNIMYICNKYNRQSKYSTKDVDESSSFRNFCWVSPTWVRVNIARGWPRVAFNSLWIFVYRWNMMIQDDIGCSMTMTINYDKWRKRLASFVNILKIVHGISKSTIFFEVARWPTASEHSSSDRSIEFGTVFQTSCPQHM